MARDDDAIRMPHDDDLPSFDVWDTTGRFDSQKAQFIYEQSKHWSPEQQAAMLSVLRAAETRARVKSIYGHPAEIAVACDPRFVMTPAIDLTSKSIERVLRSHKPINLAISEPPQEGKSTLAAVWSSIRALQLDPDFHIVLATYGDVLAQRHSREIRRIIDSHGSGVVDSLTGLPVEDKIGLRLRAGANRVDAWSVEGGKGGLIAAGVGAAITGHPADLVIIDDPFKGMREADSKVYREQVEEWFSSTIMSRLSPAASIILIQCMTGDTPVLRPDGTETPLADIQPGDEIATYENGELSTSVVRNWASQGLDSIYTIKMKSGRTVRANARHPFLITDKDGNEAWVRLRELLPGDRMVTLDGTGQFAQSMTANLRSHARACVCPTTTKSDGQTVTSLRLSISAEIATCDTDTASASPIIGACSPSRAGSAQAAGNLPAQTTAPLIGLASCASTIAMTPGACAACSATTATSSLDAPEQPNDCGRARTISTDEVVAIEPCGVAEVFDIQVDRTENFIANGLVSHNTRWHPEDLMGKVLTGERSLPPEERTWKHINIPAISEEGIKDSLGRPPGVPMISARDTDEAKRDFVKKRRDVGERTWYALYQGSPRNPAGGLFSRRDFENYRLTDVPLYSLAAVVGVDPADSGEGDEAGIIGGVLMEDGKVALTHDRSAKYTAEQWSREAVILALEMGAREIAVEAYSASTTYVQVVRKAYTAIHNEAIKKRSSGAALTPVEQRALTDIPPFLITKWRGASKADAVARSSLMRQAVETGNCRTVEGRLSVFEDQAADWQEGQHQPDRVAAAVIVHDKLADLGRGGTQFSSPVDRTPPPPPAWMRRKL